MVCIRSVSNAGDGFMVALDGRAPRFIEPAAFLATLGIGAFEDHVLGESEVREVTSTEVTISPSRFPAFSVTWLRDDTGALMPETGIVMMNDQPLIKASSSGPLVELARDALNPQP